MNIPPQSGRGDHRNTRNTPGPSPSVRTLRTLLPDPSTDPRENYYDAVAQWEAGDRDHHRASVAVACGDASPAELQAAAAKEKQALAAALLARGDAARVFVDLIRLTLEDSTTNYAMLRQMLDLLRPILEPVADRLADLEQRVANLEILAGGGAA